MLPPDASTADVRDLIHRYYASLFPKTCPHCGRGFQTLREYVEATVPAGRYISYDVDAGHFAPERLVGTYAFANCPCGDTLALGTDGLPHETRLALLAWVQAEAARRSMAATEFLDWLRTTLRQQILAESGPPAA
ncbi:MAG: hypothetical protein R2745_17965 [Vicinamibacterales bacterium]